MMEKTLVSLLLLFALGACDQKQEQESQGDSSEYVRRTIRSDRSARNIPSTRDKLRAAFEAAKTKERSEERNTALVEVARKALEPAPDIAAEVIRELPAGIEEKHALIEAYLEILMKDEKNDEFLMWADSLGDKRDIIFARAQLSLMLADKNPEQAAGLLPVSGFSAVGVDPAAEQVLHNWVAKKPGDAVAWTTRLPAGEARTAGYKVIFTQWLGDDSLSALSWAASQTNPYVRREAVNGMVEALNEIPDIIRNSFLDAADPVLRAEIEQRLAETARQVPVAEPTPEPEQETPPESQPEPLTEPQSQPTPDSSPDQEIESEPAPESEFEPAEEPAESE